MLYREDQKLSAFYLVGSIVVSFLILLFAFLSQAHADDWSDEQIVNAIYHAEGGRKASRPYGIMLDKCTWSNKEWCELACYQTVRNNRKRYADWGYKDFPTYLEFLANRYAPPQAHHLNKNWLPNVLAILKRGGK